MNTVHCIGELLIDWVCEDASSDLVNGTTFVKKAGGAPANVAAVVSKHGGNLVSSDRLEMTRLVSS